MKWLLHTVLWMTLLLASINLFTILHISPPAKEAMEQTEDAKQELHLVAVGDILLHDVVYEDARIGENHYNFRPMLAKMKPYIEKADFSFANQESVIGGVEIGLSTYPSFNSPVEAAEALKFAGFDLINLANNHALDRGQRALHYSISSLEQLGMLRTGAYTSQNDRNTIRTISKNGITCAVLSYTYGLNGITELPQPHAVSLIEEAQMKEEVTRAKQIADAVIVMLHFGKEYEYVPNEEQKQLVQQLADLGVSIIFGHHPHVLQPPAIIEGKDGNKTFVAYSLGNFLAGQEREETYFGGLISIALKRERDGELALHDPAFLPTYTDAKNGYKVIPLDHVTEKQYPKAEEKYEEIVAHMKSLLPTLRIIKGR